MADFEFSIDFYQKRLKVLTIDLNKYLRYAKIWIVVRLITFTGIAMLTYFAFPYDIYTVFLLVFCIALFLFFVRKSIENTEHLNYIKRLIVINENEIKASNLDFSGFKDGNSYKDSMHAFSYDMDVFGTDNFFQFFNRTVTKKGEQKLVNRLLNGVSSQSECVEAIDELKEKKEWYQSYLAYGSLLEKGETETNLNLLSQKDFSFKSWVKIMQFILPVLTVALMVLYYFSFVSGVQFVIIAIVLMLPIRQMLKKTNAIHQTLSKVGKRAKAVREQLAIIETEKFSSALLITYYDKLFRENKNAYKGLTELSKLVKEAEFRDNVIVAIILNFFLAWDLRLLAKTKKWLYNYGENLDEWEDIVYEMETLISGANFRFNYEKNTVVPILMLKGNKVEIVQMGHPLIPQNKLVKNNFFLSEKEKFAIVTGPNMAGKSTFLRSIGINLMLAQAGFHVFAEKFVFPNMKLYSSMRTNDNLTNETSYFHAELLRLRYIVDAIEKGENVFIILDEILKGTNSKDKEEGSSKFLQKLVKLNVKGIIATHDLSLTSLAETNEFIVNKYFDTEIQGDSISFDYCIRDGVAKNMNASFLLKKMNLID